MLRGLAPARLSSTSSRFAFASGASTMKIPGLPNLWLLLAVSRRSIRKFLRHNMLEYSAALSYRALFALVPFFTVLVALLGFLGISGFFDWMIAQASYTLQEQYAEFVDWLIRQGQHQAQSGLLSGVVLIAAW